MLKQRCLKENTAQKVMNNIAMAVYYCHANNINLDNLGTDSFEFVDDNTMQVKLTDIWLNKH